MANRWHILCGKAVRLVDRSSPAVGNLDDDADLEVVVGTVGHKVYAFNPDGSTVPGWPVTVSAEVNSSPAIGDINGDGQNEVVVGVGWAQDPQNDGGIYAFSRDGRLLPNWPVRTQDVTLGPDSHLDGVFASSAGWCKPSADLSIATVSLRASQLAQEVKRQLPRLCGRLLGLLRPLPDRAGQQDRPGLDHLGRRVAVPFGKQRAGLILGRVQTVGLPSALARCHCLLPSGGVPMRTF